MLFHACSSTDHAISPSIYNDGQQTCCFSDRGKLIIFLCFSEFKLVSIMKTEMDALLHNVTWELLLYPNGGEYYSVSIKYL